MLRFTILLFVITTISCATTVPQKGGVSAKDVLGDWVWVKTHCCGRVMNVILDTAQEKTIISFNKQGQQLSYQGGEVVRTKSYEVYTDENLGSTVIKLEGVSQVGMLSLREDTLVINYGYMDLQTEFYVRTKR